MNDYNLINKLLEENSPQSLLKLKMIVDFKNFNFIVIRQPFRLRFAILFKEYFDKLFSDKPSAITYFSIEERLVVTKIFQKSFNEGLLKLKNGDEFSKNFLRFQFFDEVEEVKKMFPDIKFNI